MQVPEHKSSGGDAVPGSAALPPQTVISAGKGRLDISMPIATSAALQNSAVRYDELALLFAGVMQYETEVREMLGTLGYAKIAASGERKEGDLQERHDPELWEAVSQHEALVRSLVASLERAKMQEAVRRGKSSDSSRRAAVSQPGAPSMPQPSAFVPLPVAAGAPVPYPYPSPSSEPGGDPEPNPNPQPNPPPPPPQPIPYGAVDPHGDREARQGPKMSLAEPKMYSGELSGGTETRGDIQHWVEYMDKYFELTRTKEDLKFPYAMAHLEGAALHWANRILRDGTPRIFNPSVALQLRLADPAIVESQTLIRDLDHGTWPWLKRKLLAQFQSFRTASYLRWRLDALSQWRNGWTVEQYWNEFEKISSRIPDMSQQERLHAFLRGLKPGLAEKVNGAYWKVPNVEQAAAIAAEEELLRQRYAEVRGLAGRKPFFKQRAHLSSLAVNPYDEEEDGGMSAGYGEETYEGAHTQLHAMSNNNPSFPRPGQASNSLRPTGAGGGGGYNNFNGAAAVGQPKCHYCGRTNHFVKDCRDKMFDLSKGIFRANKFQPLPAGAAAAGGRNNQSGKGGKGHAQQGKEEAHHRE